MRHPLLFRALVGGAGLASCLALLSGVARAADMPPYGQAPILVRATAIIAPDLFDTVALPIKPDRYAEGWERARRDASALPQMRLLIAPAQGLAREQQIAYIQSAVTRRIRWISDATEWGFQDYWASAAETLQHGAGDMEDRAILKMQALRALGFPNRDLYLTIGRDKVGGPVTVLLVRLGSRVYVLDDTGGAPFTTDRRPEFRPILTFGYGASWIHGRRIAARTVAGTLATTAATVRTGGQK